MITEVEERLGRQIVVASRPDFHLEHFELSAIDRFQKTVGESLLERRPSRPVSRAVSSAYLIDLLRSMVCSLLRTWIIGVSIRMVFLSFELSRRL